MSDFDATEILEPGLAVEYDSRHMDTFREITFDDDALVDAIVSQQKNMSFYVDVPDDYIAVEYDWSTGLDFGDHEGGGDFIVLVPDAGWNEYDPILSVNYEWNDGWMEENGIEHPSDIKDVAEALANGLAAFVERIQ